MTDCLFCRIAAGELPADIVYQEDDVVAFRDLHPQAPHHILVIPRRHVATVNDFAAGDAELVGRLVLTARDIAGQLGLAEDGYRLNLNTNEKAGQTVFHVHLHLLGGREFGWPPG
ncbi:MAG: histidine triad nucleotide-binding protein [Thiohalospira sp.]